MLMIMVIIFIFDIRYQTKIPAAQPTKVEYKFDGVVPADIFGSALVLTNKLVSISSDGQKQCDLK